MPIFENRKNCYTYHSTLISIPAQSGISGQMFISEDSLRSNYIKYELYELKYKLEEDTK